MERYVCVHGHFYQPPRENPWLEGIELQDSAYPYHDWNERITAECYGPNGASRILDGECRIKQIANNYARISFNFGPTLLAWMESKAPDAYETVLEADRESQRAFSGHGSALAQAYNHIIMPLANPRDKYTQVRWGIRDFEHRFGRSPEGMWLPETAVDLETLDILAQLGLRFTILAPHQASRVRPAGEKAWQDVAGGHIDPTRAYVQRLPSGRTINLFFYDGPISRAVAFEGLLRNGEDFARRLSGAFREDRCWPQLVHGATDGETYGHHHPFGDMSLAFALDRIQSSGLARLTNYGEYLEKHPPTHEVQTFENTSWSCPHGVQRWKSDCGCNSGGHPGWRQSWRGPLREALDWLRDTLVSKYEERAGKLLKDPWVARDDYIEVVLDRSPVRLQRFLDRHARHALDDGAKTAALKLLELQRHAMLMYTSCGWFFDELSGIETVQILQYAGRAVQLAQDLFGDDIESQFQTRLGRSKSNIPEHGDGRRIYETFVKPAMVDLPKVAAHYAISSLFEEYGAQTRIYSYIVSREDYRSSRVGKARLAVGRAMVTSEVTRESAVLTFGVLHFGDHNLNAGVRVFRGEEAYLSLAKEVTDSFSVPDLPQVIRTFDKHFGTSNYTIRHLFRDERSRALARVLEATLVDVEVQYRQVYQGHHGLMRFLAGLGSPLPKALYSATEFVLNTELRRALGSDTPDPVQIEGLLDEVRAWNVALDTQGLGYLLGQSLNKMMNRFVCRPDDLSLLQDLEAALPLVPVLPFEVSLWKAQNLYSFLLKSIYPRFQAKAQEGDEVAREWSRRFLALGRLLLMGVA